MGIRINNSKVLAMYINGQNILAGYINGQLVWPEGSPGPSPIDILSCFYNGYWIDEYPWTDNMPWTD